MELITIAYHYSLYIKIKLDKHKDITFSEKFKLTPFGLLKLNLKTTKV